MKKIIDFKFILIVCFFALSGVLAWHLYFNVYHRQDTVNIHLFPKSVNGWNSKELTITEDEYLLLETKNAFARQYTSPRGDVVYLLIVYSQSNRKVSHPPEICYTGNGITVISNNPLTVEGVLGDAPFNVNRLKLEKGNISQLAYYWFKVGNIFTSSYWRQQILLAVKTFSGNPPSSALIRVSADIQDGDDRKARDDIEKFMKLVVPSLEKYLP